MLRRRSPTELFQTYDLATGKLKHVESIVHERLTVTFPSVVWTNGEKLPVKVLLLQNHGYSALSRCGSAPRSFSHLILTFLRRTSASTKGRMFIRTPSLRSGFQPMACCESGNGLGKSAFPANGRGLWISFSTNPSNEVAAAA